MSEILSKNRPGSQGPAEIENYIATAPCGRNITKIIVHCSATPEGRDVGADEIRRWHTADRGFSDIGYHFVIRLDGTIEIGRPINKTGAHCLGQNSCSIGICYIGGLKQNFSPADTRTPQQKESLIILIAKLKQRFSKAAVYGHRDFAHKNCPCFNAFAEYNPAAVP